MTGVILGVVGLCIFVLIRRRNFIRDQRAGLDSTRPTFTIEPPARRLGKRARELL